MDDCAPRVPDVVRNLVRHPWELLVLRWNWKSAVTSALMRGGIFFSANLAAGWRAAVGAMLVEFGYRTILSGFYGSVTQAFRRAEPAWAAALAVMVILPAGGHIIEFLVHWSRGTPKLATSIVSSVAFTILSTLFNLHAMRRGVLVVGDGHERRTLWQDLRAMPSVVASFVAVGPLALWRLARETARRT